MNPEPETIDALADELYEWVETASMEDVLAYVKRLPEEKLEVYEELRSKLLFLVRYVRRQVLQRHFSGKVSKLLSEPEINEFMGDCSLYEANSVLTNYVKQFPTMADVAFISNPQDEAKKWYQTWRNVIVFRVSRNFVSFEQMLQQIVTLGWAEADLAAMRERAIAVLSFLDTKTTENNFLPVDLTPQEKEQLATMLSGLRFIPTPEQESLKLPENQARLITLIQKILILSDVMLPAMEAGVQKGDLNRFRILLFDDLVDREEVALAFEDKMSRDDAVVDPYLDGLNEYLLNLFQEKFLLSGVVPTELLKAYAPLPAPTKELFRALLRVFITDTETIKLMLDDVDPDTVMAKIEAAGSKVAADAAVQELSAFLRVDNEQIGLEILKAVARIYYP